MWHSPARPLYNSLTAEGGFATMLFFAEILIELEVSPPVLP